MIYSQAELVEICEQAIEIAKQASKTILECYKNFDSTKDLHLKEDRSPVTIADISANHIIVNALAEVSVGEQKLKLPVLSEESADIHPVSTKLRLQWDDYWLVDPLDGTKEFISQTGEFCINIALIQQHRPIIGVIYSPCDDWVYYAVSGFGAFKRKNGEKSERIFAKKGNLKQNGLQIASSKRQHATRKYNDFLKILEDQQIRYEKVYKGSALKFGLVAEGLIDLYPRFGLTSEWDTAAGDCIVHEAGGLVCDLNGKLLQYNCQEALINPEFIVAGNKDFDWFDMLKKVL